MIRRHADLLLALSLAAASVAQALAWPIAPRAAGVAIALAATLPVAWRRSHPLAAALAGTAIWFVPTDGHLVFGYVAAFVLYFSLAAHVEDLEPVVAVTAFGVGVSITNAWIDGKTPGGYLAAPGAVLLPALAGRLVRHERVQAQRLRALGAELAHERERTGRLAVAEERARIARELYDLLARRLRSIASQTGAAEGVLESEPERARRPLRAIRRSAEEALGEMQRLPGVVPEGGEAPRPGLAQLPELVERARAAGMPVTLLIEGSPRPVSAGLDLSAFRIVQEALRNVHKHARGAPATVHVMWDRRALSLQVRDVGAAGSRPAPSGDGHGLVGMRERVRLHGGELTAGRLPGGGFEVMAVLPL
jgi:signal transduction histidine kinase